MTKRLVKPLKPLYSKLYSLKCIFRSIAPNDPFTAVAARISHAICQRKPLCGTTPVAY